MPMFIGLEFHLEQRVWQNPCLRMWLSVQSFPTPLVVRASFKTERCRFPTLRMCYRNSICRRTGTVYQIGTEAFQFASSSEIVLPGRRRTHTVVAAEPLPALRGLPTTPLVPEGKLTERLEAMIDRETVLRPWRLAQLVRAGVSFSDALAGHRTLGREDRTILGTVAIIAISASGLVGFFPLVFGWAVALVLAWLGIGMGFRAVWHRFRAQDVSPPDSIEGEN